METEAVKLWRDTFKLNLKVGFKRDIEVTVTNLDLWREVITHWGYFKDGKWVKYSPLNVKGMLSEYERRARQANGRTTGTQQHVERTSEAETSPIRLPQRSDRGMFDVREGTGVHVRSGGFSLEETLTKALRQNHRS